MSKEEFMSVLFVPQWITKTFTEVGIVRFLILHKTCCVLSPLMPRLTNLTDQKLYSKLEVNDSIHTLGNLHII